MLNQSSVEREITVEICKYGFHYKLDLGTILAYDEKIIGVTDLFEYSHRFYRDYILMLVILLIIIYAMHW